MAILMWFSPSIGISQNTVETYSCWMNLNSILKSWNELIYILVTSELFLSFFHQSSSEFHFISWFLSLGMSRIYNQNFLQWSIDTFKIVQNLELYKAHHSIIERIGGEKVTDALKKLPRGVQCGPATILAFLSTRTDPNLPLNFYPRFLPQCLQL